MFIEWYYEDVNYYLEKFKRNCFKKLRFDFFTQAIGFLIWTNRINEIQIENLRKNGFNEEVGFAYEDIAEYTKNW